MSEEEGLDGSDPRLDWFSRKVDAEACKRRWLTEWKEQADDGEDVEDIVSLTLVEVPITRAEMARWLVAYDVRVI